MCYKVHVSYLIMDLEDLDLLADVVLSPLTYINGTEDQPLDGGRKPISTLNSYKLPQLARPESWKKLEMWDGQMRRSYTVDFARLMRGVHQRNQVAPLRERLVAISGMTSSGLMKTPPALESAQATVVNGVQPPTLFSVEQLTPFDPEIQMEDGEPRSICVPGMASIDAINAFLKEKHPGYEVYYDITTSSESTIAANFFTGGLGDNRQGLDVLQMMLVHADGRVEELTDPLAIQALRGTQGYAGMGTEFTLQLKKVPEVEEMLVLDLNGASHEEAYGESLPQLMEYIAPYMQGRDADGVWVDGVEIVDSSGLKTILRVTGGPHTSPAQMAQKLLQELGAKSVGSILLRVRHGSDEIARQKWNGFLEGLGRMSRPEQEVLRLVNEAYGSGVVSDDEAEAMGQIISCAEEEEFLEAFGEKKEYMTYLLSLFSSDGELAPVSRTVVRRIQSILDPAQRDAWRALRKEIPEMRRKEGEKLASGSMDRDIKFKLLDANVSDPTACRGKIAQAVHRVMGVYLKIQKKAEEKGCHVMWNGHLNYLSPEDAHLGYYDGGGNLHLAITAKDASVNKSTVDALLLELTEELTALHGQVEEGVQFVVQEGEKHYSPTDKKTIHEFLHFVQTEGDLAVARMVATLSADEMLNFRAPDYQRILLENGLSHVWERVEKELRPVQGNVRLLAAK